MSDSNEENVKVTRININKNDSIIMTVIGLILFVISIYKLLLQTDYYSIFITIGFISLLLFVIGSVSIAKSNEK